MTIFIANRYLDLNAVFLQIWPCCQKIFNSEKMRGITHFYFDGEELTVKTAQKLRERFPRCSYYQNAYGPTEATVALSAVAVTDEMLTTLKRLPPIGYTKADSPTFIIDEEGNKLPNGEQGEIIVSGPAVSKVI